MAGLYNQQTTGLPYQRSRDIHISNEYKKMPFMKFEEEMLSDYGAAFMTKHTGSLSILFSPDKVYNMLNPETGEDLGSTFSQGQFMAMLYSIYIAEATARDIEQATAAYRPPPEEPEPDPEPDPVPEG